MPDLNTIVSTFGILGVTCIVFAESGLLIGFFLPGDSLLITAGLLASTGHISFVLLLPLAIVAAIVGDSVGYATGKALGQKLFSKEDSRFFKKRYLEQSHVFFEKHGSWAIVIARFTPIIRTFVPVMAGVGKMPYRKFVTFNIIGGVAWAGGLLCLSYIAGKYIPGFAHYIDYVVIAVVILSLLPLLRHIRKPEHN